MFHYLLKYLTRHRALEHANDYRLLTIISEFSTDVLDRVLK